MIYKIVGFDIRNFAFIWGVCLIGFSLGKFCIFKKIRNRKLKEVNSVVFGHVFMS